MTNSLDVTPSTIDRIRHDLIGLKMPRALEALDHVWTCPAFVESV